MNKILDEAFDDPIKPEEFKIAITTLIAFSRNSGTLKTQMLELIKALRKQVKITEDEKLTNLINESMVLYYKLDIYSKLCEEYYKNSKESDLFTDVSLELFETIKKNKSNLTEFINKAKEYRIQFPTQTRDFMTIYGNEIDRIAEKFNTTEDANKKEAVMSFIEDFRLTIKKDIPAFKERLKTILRQVTGKEDAPAEESDEAEASFSDKDFAAFLENAKTPIKIILGKPEMFVKEESGISVKKEYESFIDGKIKDYDFPEIQVIYDMIIKIQEQNLSKKQLFDAFQEKFPKNPGEILGGVLRFLQTIAEEKTKIEQDTKNSQQTLVQTFKSKGMNYLKSFEIGVPLFIDEGGDLNTELALNSVYSDSARATATFNSAKELLTTLKLNNSKEFKTKYGNITEETAINKLSALSALVKERNREIARDITNVWNGYGLAVKDPTQAKSMRYARELSKESKLKLKSTIQSMAETYQINQSLNPKRYLNTDLYYKFLKGFSVVIDLTSSSPDLVNNNSREDSNLNDIQEQITKLIKPYLHERIKSKCIAAK
tara:strand:- start:250 stop:1887 length:1638 start_codon:yes stop_codon:yes gene_type:complete